MQAVVHGFVWTECAGERLLSDGRRSQERGLLTRHRARTWTTSGVDVAAVPLVHRRDPYRRELVGRQTCSTIIIKTQITSRTQRRLMSCRSQAIIML